MRSEWGALRSALGLSLALLAVGYGAYWMSRQKEPDFRVGRRVALEPRTQLRSLPQVGLGGETRIAWQVPAGQVLRLPLTIPGEQTFLRFREGYLYGIPDVSVTVVYADGQREELLRDSATREAWRRRRVRLPARTGMAVDVEIAAHDGAGRAGLGRVYIADPVLESKGRPVDITEYPVLVREVTGDLLAAYGHSWVAAPPTSESAQVALPGPDCVPLEVGATVRLPWNPPGGTGAAAGRLELVLHAGPRGQDPSLPVVATGEVQVLAGERVVARVPLDFLTSGAREVEVDLELPLASAEPDELGFRRIGDPGLFVGLREARISAPRQVWRKTAQAGGEPNVLLVIADSIRPDRLGCYGYASAVTPALDELAAKGGRYETVLAPSSWALPNIATLLTGTSPPTHGLGLAPHRVLTRRLATLASNAAAAGYSTAAFSSNGWLAVEQGLDQGQGHFSLSVVPAPIVVESALDWLTEVQEFQWFLTLHVSDATYPHLPEERDLLAVGRDVDPGLMARLRALDSRPGVAEGMAAELGTYYDAEVAGVDRAVGDVMAWLEARDLADDTLVIFVGSQGEEFFEHGGRLHGRTLYDEVVKLPLIVAGPGVPGPFVESTPIELVDVTRMIVHLAGFEAEGNLQGRLPEPFAGQAEIQTERHPAHALLVPFSGVVQPHLGAVREGRQLLLIDHQRGRRQLFDSSVEAQGLGPPVDQLAGDPDHELRVTAERLGRSWDEWFRAGLLAGHARPVRWKAERL